MEYASTSTWRSHGKTSARRTSQTAGSHLPNPEAPALHHSSTSKLDFEQAMFDFQTMFPSADPDVIEQVLRTNNGAVEKTIDDLLLICSEKSNSSLTPESLTKTSFSKGRSLSRKQSKWHPPLLGPLPDGFLRITSPKLVSMAFHEERQPIRSTLNVGQVCNPKKAQSATGTSKARAFSLSSSPETINEENLINYLQNEEFLRELQRDEEFMTALQKDTKIQPGKDNSGFLTSSDSSMGQAPSNRPPEDTSDFSNKLKKNMGSGRKKSPKNTLKTAPSSYNHLVEDDNGLVSDDDDHDDDHVAEGPAHVRLNRRASHGL